MENLLKPSPEVQDMMDWASEKGIKWPKLHYPVRFHPGYFGSVATQDISPGEKIIWAPNSALFTSKLAYESELKEVFDQGPEIFSRPILALATFLIWEKFKGPESKWAVFIRAQPEVNFVLQDWEDDELAELQDERLVLDCKVRKEYHLYVYGYWKSFLEQFGRFSSEMLSLNEFTWAYRLVGTRSFGKFMPYITMIPVAEFLNHENVNTFYSYQRPEQQPDASTRYAGRNDCKDHDDELLGVSSDLKVNWTGLVGVIEKVIKVSGDEVGSDEIWDKLKANAKDLDCQDENEAKAHEVVRPADMDLSESDEKIACICTGPDESYKKGEQIFMTYGRYSNRQLLVSYGFALKVNKYNYASVVVNIQDFLGSIGQPCETERPGLEMRFKIKEREICEKLLMFVRFLLWKFDGKLIPGGEPSDIDNETQVLAHAKTILIQNLAGFDTSLEEDRRIIDSCENIRKFFAVLYRMQVKEILTKQVALIDKALRYFHSNEALGIEDNHGYFLKISKLKD